MKAVYGSALLTKPRPSWTLTMAWALVVAALSGHAAAGEIEAELVLSPQARAIVETNRPIWPGPSGDVIEREAIELLYNYTGLEDEIDVAQIWRNQGRSVRTGQSHQWHISPHYAAEEVELLFEVLKYGYAGYEYFGGDEAFEAAKDGILREIGEFAEEIPMWQYIDIIAANLSFVRDGHLSIGERRICEYHQFRASPTHSFCMDNEGQFWNADGERILSIDGQSPSAFMKPSIDEAGDIVYLLGMVLPEGNGDVALKLEYADGCDEMAWLVPFSPMVLDGPVYELSEVGGVPLITCGDFRDLPGQRRAIARFAEDAEGFRDEDVIILDLRSNRGGRYAYGREWCRRLSGGDVGPSTYSRRLVTDVALALLSNTLPESDDNLSSLDNQDDAPWMKDRSEDPELPGWSYAVVEQEARAGRTPFVVVLLDSYVASAAEVFVRRLRYCQNTVFIGTNTRGAALCGNAGVMELPYSGLKVSLPTMICFDGEMQNIDGCGYFPDFWVHPDFVMERAVRFIEKQLVSVQADGALGQTSEEEPGGIMRQ
ncbi:MAG TPA: S41 family peptidase [Bacillota bacterium]|nr:S41 family peptidase [Bacillota bacterium]HOL51313.1 S41 family peptidase [Bacillota bacterium]HPQ02015.1 S41 family peptidase [Bacillota bacterium]